jgi:hypothetical protein
VDEKLNEFVELDTAIHEFAVARNYRDTSPFLKSALDHHWQSQETRLELGVCLSDRFRPASEYD